MTTIPLLHNPHPGETLKEFLGNLGITQYRLAKDTGIPHSHVTSIIKGRQGITAATALRFGKYFGTAPEYWLNLLHMHDLAAAREDQATALERIHPLGRVNVNQYPAPSRPPAPATPKPRITIDPELGYPVVDGGADAPISRMTIEEILKLEQESLGFIRETEMKTTDYKQAIMPDLFTSQTDDLTLPTNLTH